MDKVLQDIGLCRRAGALCLGTDAVTGALKAQRAAVVVISEQLSEKSQKEMRFLSKKYQAEIVCFHIRLSRSAVLHESRSALCALTDQSLGEKLLKDAAAVGQGELGGLQNDTKI